MEVIGPIIVMVGMAIAIPLGLSWGLFKVTDRDDGPGYSEEDDW